MNTSNQESIVNIVSYVILPVVIVGSLVVWNWANADPVFIVLAVIFVVGLISYLIFTSRNQ